MRYLALRDFAMHIERVKPDYHYPLLDDGQLELGQPLVLSDAGLYSRASSRQPSGGRIGAIVGSCIEGNRRAWGSLMNGVDDDFE